LRFGPRDAGTSGADMKILLMKQCSMPPVIIKISHMSDFEFAKDKILMGTERRSMVISDEEKRNTSYHETGHVLVARMIPEQIDSQGNNNSPRQGFGSNAAIAYR